MGPLIDFAIEARSVRLGEPAVIKSVDHIGIAVHSIEESRVLYESMGLEVTEIEEVPQEQVRVAMIPCGEVRLELLEPMSPESPIAKHLEKRGQGLHHVCLGTDDIAADDAQLREKGFNLLREQPTIGAGGALVQFLHPKSGGGVLYELSEPHD